MLGFGGARLGLGLGLALTLTLALGVCGGCVVGWGGGCFEKKKIEQVGGYTTFFECSAYVLRLGRLFLLQLRFPTVVCLHIHTRIKNPGNPLVLMLQLYSTFCSVKVENHACFLFVLITAAAAAGISLVVVVVGLSCGA